MADTMGLMKTRGEWMDAVESGETSLTHAEWYKKKQLEKQANGNGEKKPKPTLAMMSM